MGVAKEVVGRGMVRKNEWRGDQENSFFSENSRTLLDDLPRSFDMFQNLKRNQRVEAFIREAQRVGWALDDTGGRRVQVAADIFATTVGKEGPVGHSAAAHIQNSPTRIREKLDNLRTQTTHNRTVQQVSEL